jgi:hypothetical protein
MGRHHSGQTRMVQRTAVIGLATALLSVLMSCSSGPSASGLAHSTKHSQVALGPTGTSATAPEATSVLCSAHALPQGWTWYRDARYPFQIAAPPQWRSGAFEYVPDGSDLGAASPSYSHVVDFFGPGSHGQAASNGMERFDGFPPVITIEIGVGSQARIDGFTQNVVFLAQPTPVCIGSTPVTLYVFHGGEELAALLPAGPQGHPYAFSVAGDNTTVYDQLFLTMLPTFSAAAGG